MSADDQPTVAPDLFERATGGETEIVETQEPDGPRVLDEADEIDLRDGLQDALDGQDHSEADRRGDLG